MIRGGLKRCQSAINLMVLSTPLVAFVLAGYVRFATRLIPPYSSDADPFSYFGLLIVATILWAIAVDHYGLATLDHHLQGSGNIRRVIKTCLATYACLLAVTFFYRATTFSRVFIWLSSVNIFLLCLLEQTILHRVL